MAHVDERNYQCSARRTEPRKKVGSTHKEGRKGNFNLICSIKLQMRIFKLARNDDYYVSLFQFICVFLTILSCSNNLFDLQLEEAQEMKNNELKQQMMNISGQIEKVEDNSF